jgi:lactate 2-monooxygenase
MYAFRQSKIYHGGLFGQRPRVPVGSAELEAAARRALSQRVFDFIAGGAGSEETLRENQRAFRKWAVAPRMLRDVSRRDLSFTLWGRRWPAPVFFCPIGALDLARPEGDVALALAGKRCGLPVVISSQASACMEDSAQLLGNSPRWFQLYWGKSNELALNLVSRAERCGCEALVVTVDTPLQGWRPRDLTAAFHPFAYGYGLAQYFSDPVFQHQIDDSSFGKSRYSWSQLWQCTRNYSRQQGDFWGNLRSQRALRAVRQYLHNSARAGLTWADLDLLRQRTKLPILLKGILRADDAKRALDAGVDGIMVSNHGGRQVDGACASLEALVGVVRAIAGRAPIFLDGGVRSGADVFKALALGATAVGLGRPYVYGLALAGADGILEVVNNLLAELDIGMALAGCADLDQLRQEGMILRRDLGG